LVFFGHVLAACASATVSGMRAEFKSGEPRVEVKGAAPNATVTVMADSVASRRADGPCAFRVEATGFGAASCSAAVGDGPVDVPPADE
jgi:hypothetical protein